MSHLYQRTRRTYFLILFPNLFFHLEYHLLPQAGIHIHDKFHYAVNIANNSLITPDGIIYDSPASVLGNISVIKYDDTVTVDSVKAQIADAVQYNKYMILWVDSDSAHYDAVGLEEILDYALTHTGIVYPTNITSAMQEIHETIGNKLLLLDGIYITEENGDKYLNW